MRTKKYFITKITAILLVIFLTFANVAQVSAAFAAVNDVDFGASFQCLIRLTKPRLLRPLNQLTKSSAVEERPMLKSCC